MNKKLLSCGALALLVAVGACGRGDKDQFQAAVDSLARPRDSAIKAMDSTGASRNVDTTKLGAAKTESILTKARKTP